MRYRIGFVEDWMNGDDLRCIQLVDGKCCGILWAKSALAARALIDVEDNNLISNSGEVMARLVVVKHVFQLGKWRQLQLKCRYEEQRKYGAEEPV